MYNICPKTIKLFLSLTFSFILFSALSSETVYAASCGNGVCQSSQGETCSTCLKDCGTCPVPTTPPAPTSTTAPVPTTPPAPTSTTAPGQPTSTPVPGAPTAIPSQENPDSSSSTAPSVTYYPSVNLNTYPTNPTNTTSLSFSGTTSIEQGRVSLIEYTITDNAGWTQTQLNNGSFSFTTPGLPEGVYTIKVRAKSEAGVFTQDSNYASKTVTIATTPPNVILDKITPNPTKNQTPTIKGKATARLVAIQKIEISIDDGKNWQVANQVGNTFNMTVKNKLEDGNYPIRARALDAAGNIGQSEAQTLIIDIIPPIIGGSMQTLGPLILVPDNNGVVRLVAGAEAIIALSMKGGVTEAKIETQEKSFDLKLTPGTNIWFGKVKFEKEGEKEIKISAIDGAANKSERNLQTILVEDFGKIIDGKTLSPIEGAQVSIYLFETISKQWILWEGASFGQNNPQTTYALGNYSFMLPSGRYYVEAKALGFSTTQSEILDLYQTTILNYSFPLTPKPTFVLNLPFFGKVTLTTPSFIPQTLKTSLLEKPAPTTSKSEYILPPGTIAPALSLPNLKNEQVQLSQYRNKKVLITFLSPWSSPSLEQASILSEIATTLSANQKVFVVSLQESQASTETFMKRGNYKFEVLVDKDGQSSINYKITLLPQHFFIDSEGKIQGVHVGVITQKEALEKLANLP